MKKNKIIVGIIFSGIGSAHAGLGSVHAEASGDPGLQRFIEKNNLPQPGSGIQIVPFSQTSFTQDKKILQDFNSSNKLGYKKQFSDDAKLLLIIEKDKYYPGTKETYENSNPHDTHIKASLSQIKLAFLFNGVTFIPQNNILGYAVSGGWENGWTGISEIFLWEAIGVCSYNKHNVALNRSAVRLVKEFVTYDINSKPTQVFASGQDEGGYSYKVSWYDNDFYHKLICANKIFSEKIKQDTIALAKKIDLDPQ